ncbi:MAG: hypothetical protein ACYDC6_02255 [Acidobacteriaceae bacterium]
MRTFRLPVQTATLSLALAAVMLPLSGPLAFSQSSPQPFPPATSQNSGHGPTGFSSSRSNNNPGDTPPGTPAALPEEGNVSSMPVKDVQKAPAVIDPNGPATAVESSESVFDVMAALNTCGYDTGLAESDPLRQKIRDDINQALAQSEPARQSRDKLCAFIQSHSMNSSRLNVAAYISLALYLTPPPGLTPNVAPADLPPDAAPLSDLVPRLKDFAQAVGLHVIWVIDHPAYEADVDKVHAPLSQMLVQMDLYLKQPPAGYGNRRFLVILEPLIAPGEVNARVYGGDYIVVASPMNGHMDLAAVKHTYLHFELEPLIYARSESIDALAPILELVQPAPLPFAVKNDILALVTECIIRAIEAHTMDTGVPAYKIPAHIDRNQLAAVNNAENAYEHKVSRVRQDAVQKDMVEGYILTRYFYDQLHIFSNSPITLQESVGEMVYGMNVDIEKRRVQDIVFVSHSDQDVLQRTAALPALLDQAERKLASGDTAGAAQLAQQALAQRVGDPGRAQFILARADIMNGKMEAAQQAFTQAAQTSHDPRTVAWSHIYLGRLDDLQEDRPAAIAEYEEAMKSRDSKPDTKNAAESGLKTPFAPPQSARHASSASGDRDPQ